MFVFVKTKKKIQNYKLMSTKKSLLNPFHQFKIYVFVGYNMFELGIYPRNQRIRLQHTWPELHLPAGSFGAPPQAAVVLSRMLY